MGADLQALFTSTARVEVLRLFLLKPGSQFYQREIERETGQPIRAIQREVERLEGIGLLVRSVEGNRVFYRLNPEFPLLAELSALFHKAAGAENVEAKEPVEPPRRAHFEPAAISQPFEWMQTPAAASLPSTLRHAQVEGEWDRAY